jgi:hypothetical protein
VIRVDNYWCHSTIVSRSIEVAEEVIAPSEDDISAKYNRGFLLSGGGNGVFGLKIPSAISDRIDAAAKKLHQAEAKLQKSFPKFPSYNPWDHIHQMQKQRGSSIQVSSVLDRPGLEFCTIFCDDSKVSIAHLMTSWLTITR